MKRTLLAFFLIINTSIFGATYYVATNGNDNNPGTISQPFATWQKGFQTVKAGDILYIRGGVYYTSGLYLGDQYNGVYVVTKSGTSDNPIRVMAYPGETPILDCAGMNGSGTRAGIYLGYLSHWHLKGLTVRNVKGTTSYHGRGITHHQASYMKYEQCTVYNCGDGFSSSAFSDYCYWINCDSHDNVDLKDGGNFADGFKLSNYQSGGNTHLFLSGCRSWHNSDDGYDFLNADGNAKGGYGTIDNSWAFNNGHSGGNGVGFKMGGYIDGTPDGGIQRTITRCVAWNNLNSGFDECCITAVIDGVFYNNIAYNNNTGHISGAAGFKFDFRNYSADHIFRNNIAFGNYWADALTPSPKCTHDHNSWDSNVSVTSSDFLSLDPSGATGPRKSDGSLPDISFLHLAPGSDLIDKGTNVGLAYNGSAPDLGAFETGTSVIQPAVPVFTGAVIENGSPSVIEITYNRSLASIVPPLSAFFSRVNTVPRSLTSVAVSGTKVILTLSSPVKYGDVVTVSYTVPSSNQLQTSDGGKAEGYNGNPVTNKVNSLTIPVFTGAVIENSAPSVIEITYNTSLANIVPPLSAFFARVNTVPRSLTSVALSGAKVILTLSSPVKYGDVVTVSYTVPSSNQLQSPDGGKAEGYNGNTVTNRVNPLPVPVFTGATVENTTPSVITMTYSLSLANIVPATAAFLVTVNSAARTVTGVAVSGTKVNLTLSSPVVYGNNVTVAYTKPASNPLQTTSGGQAASISAQTVTNNVNQVIKAPEIVNTPPSVVVNYNPGTYSGFIGTINASGSYDANKDNLTYTWKVPGNIPVSATNRPTIDFLAPILDVNKTYTFTLTVSDGKDPQTKTVPVTIIPYKPELETAQVISVEASDYREPYLPDNITDGDVRTMWSALGSDHWIILELDGSFDIHHVMMAFQYGQRKEFYFDILGSNDKVNWEPILGKSSSCAFSCSLQSFEFPATKADNKFRYVKLVGLGNSSDEWNYIAEIRIFGFRHRNPVEYEDQIAKIYPNPANEFVNIKIDEPTFVPDFVKIVSLTGKILYNDKVDPDIRQLQIPISFKHGIYLVQMGTGNITLFTQKLVVSN